MQGLRGGKGDAARVRTTLLMETVKIQAEKNQQHQQNEKHTPGVAVAVAVAAAVVAPSCCCCCGNYCLLYINKPKFKLLGTRESTWSTLGNSVQEKKPPLGRKLLTINYLPICCTYSSAKSKSSFFLCFRYLLLPCHICCLDS